MANSLASTTASSIFANLSSTLAMTSSAASSSVLSTLLSTTSSVLLTAATEIETATTFSSLSSSVLSSPLPSTTLLTTSTTSSSSSSSSISTSTLLSTTSRLFNNAQNRSSSGGRRFYTTTTSTFSPFRTFSSPSSSSSSSSFSLSDNITRALFITTNSTFTQPDRTANYVRSLGLGPVILDILVTLFLTTFITGLVLNTFLVIALMRRKRPSTPSDLVVSNMHFCLYYLFLDSLVLFNELFVTPKPSVDFNAFYVSNPFTNCAMPYLFAVFHVGMFGCITVLSAILFMNVIHPPMSRIASMRNVAMALIFIWTFCILANVHFLLAHCDRFDYEYFIEYVQNVWIKFLIVDGTAFIMSVVMLTRTITYLIKSDSPDRLLLKYEAFGYMLVLLAYSMPLIVDAVCAFAEERMTLTSHRILTVAVREISYCTIPAALARFRPLSRSDCHSLLDDIRSCCSRNFNRLTAASSRRMGGVRWSAASSGSRYFLAATNPNSGLHSDVITSGGNNGNGRANSRRLDDDQVQILSICQDPQGGFEDGL